MELKLFQVKDNNNTINKKKKLISTMDIAFKSQTKILTPRLKIYHPNGNHSFNYAYIEEFDRFYFITDIEPYPNNMFYLQLEVDVLESYKVDILESRKVNFIQKVKPLITILESDLATEQKTSYVLSTVAETDKVEEVKNE